ncbi:restriction endonuclease subunit S [Treponema sp.]|uniref:restriction endonuclease subunit S n=1 Tax=Treponema sp. TaxID=166 RepID=UPI00257F899B|nr:restriction endonuclease subunit S [Treponema sp.]
MPNGISKNEEMMKKDWTIKKLGELCRIRTGKLDANAASPNGKYPFFTCSITPLKIDSFSFDCECVLVAGNGDLNVKYYEGKFDAYQRTYIIESLDKSLLDVKYLYLFLSSYIDTLRKQAIGAIIKYIKLGNLTDANLPLPSLEEQKRIVAVLDKKFAQIETLKTAAEKNLQNAKQLFQAELEKAFSNTSWEKKRLGDCGTFKNGMNFASTESGYSIHSLGVGDFKNLYKIENTETLSEISLNAAPSEEYLLKDGDIVFVRSNGNKELVGRCLLVYPKNIPTTYSGFCIRFRKDFDQLDADFLLHFMKSDKSRKILNGKEGANISNLNQKILGDFEVPLPPLEEQKSIVAHLDSLSEKVHQLEEIYTKQLADCYEIKQAFLQKAFEGEL